MPDTDDKPLPPPPPPPDDPPPPPPASVKMVNALFCAVNMLRGTGGGFSPSEISNAADVLEVELHRLENLLEDDD